MPLFTSRRREKERERERGTAANSPTNSHLPLASSCLLLPGSSRQHPSKRPGSWSPQDGFQKFPLPCLYNGTRLHHRILAKMMFSFCKPIQSPQKMMFVAWFCLRRCVPVTFNNNSTQTSTKKNILHSLESSWLSDVDGSIFLRKARRTMKFAIQTAGGAIDWCSMTRPNLITVSPC